MQTNKAKRVMVALAIVIPLTAQTAPWILPTLEGEEGIVTPGRPKPLPKEVDARGVWEAAQRCWPARSFFALEVRAEARIGTSRFTAQALDGTVTSDRATGALVASMPLYSGIELDRERTREYQRRTDAAKIVGELIEATSKSHVLEREVELFRAVERRAQERVKHGVAETVEQLDALKTLADREGQLYQQRAKVVASQLAAEATCDKGKAHMVRDALKGKP